MKIGVVVPQGWFMEYRGWQPQAAWAQTVAVSQQADRLGFESIWLYDHFHTVPLPADEIVFEPFTALSALAALTRRVRIGHIVICTGFRNPALTAKMISTLDTISGGRAELGIGAGWKQEEWLAYGYAFPTTHQRLAALADHLEVITRMLEGGDTERATFSGRYARVAGAINRPKPIQRPRVPVMVGGNGPNVTWRLAARYADELNLDGLTPTEVAAALPVIRSRCEEISRDPASLRVSVHTWYESPGVSTPGQQRIDLFGAYRELGVHRVQSYVDGLEAGSDALEAFAADVVASGATLAGPAG
ncbi:MAG TPA: TIGR03560 family F420-dependent LLM class oxidoreductase [Candidatus Limnocylindrales bacterium]|nr:TIGR03560 family F420-dependent LLM class oxidoreductase [Candidatus Limnocylindrales bacterium]